MPHRAWVRLDNASNIFLAARSDVDPKVFRILAEMDHEIEAELLQRALDETYDRYPLYHAVLRSGVFWYYLLESELRPAVTAEQLAPCAPMSDGTGALWFLTDLVTAYTRLRFPDFARDQGADEAAALHASAGAPEAPAPEDPALPVHDLSPDSFSRHFWQSRRDRKQDEAFADAAAPAQLATVPPEHAAQAASATRSRRAFGITAKRVHRVRGTRTPDNRTRLVELTVSARGVLDLAKAEGVSPSMYLTALFFESVRRSSGDPEAPMTLAASVPVNLRQFFASNSARNFFATVRVEHSYGAGPGDLGAVARALEHDFRLGASREALETKLRRLIRFERMPALRIVPRALKDVLLSLINRGNNRGLTVAISNLGRVTLPEPAESHVRRMAFNVSAVRPQICAMSHAGLLTIGFTSPFIETDHIRQFARLLTEQGVDVNLSAPQVTEAELAEGRL